MPHESILPSPGEIHYLPGDSFPPLGHEHSPSVLMGFFLIYLAVQAQAISCTPLPPGWAPAVNLVP